jgi:hypothetical protein
MMARPLLSCLPAHCKIHGKSMMRSSLRPWVEAYSLSLSMVRSTRVWPRIIAHADMDAFYAASRGASAMFEKYLLNRRPQRHSMPCREVKRRGRVKKVSAPRSLRLWVKPLEPPRVISSR